MNIFIIPSWYPSPSSPYSGIFLREQAIIYSSQFSEDTIAISNWGTNDSRLLLEAKNFYQWPAKVVASTRILPETKQIADNLIEFFNPALTWSRRLFQGNLKSIISASAKNFESFSKEYGTPDIIHAHIAFPGGYVARELSQLYKVPYVIMENMSPFPMPGLKWRFERYGLAPLRSANRVIAVSKELSNRMSSFDIDATVIPNFIDDQFYIPKEGKVGPGKVFKFLCVGRLEPQKGHEYLLEASQTLLERGKKFEIKIIGGGSLRQNLESLILEKGLEGRVKLTGPKGKVEIRDQLQKCDAFVFPSLHESFGIAPLEAMACGKPIIGTGRGEVSEMINDSTGILVHSESVLELAGAMEQMMQNIENYSSQKVRSFYQERYSSSIATTKLRKLYREVIRQAK